MQNKTVWYGAKDNSVRFSDNQQALTQQGIDNVQSFSVQGEITGLNLIGQNQTEQQPLGQNQSQATA